MSHHGGVAVNQIFWERVKPSQIMELEGYIVISQNITLALLLYELSRMRELNDSELAEWINVAAKAAQRLKKAFVDQRTYLSTLTTSFVPFSHLTKAFHVHETVLILCRAGFGAEAFALTRIMLEMFITLRWTTNQDQNKRAEDFALLVAKRKEYAAKVFAINSSQMLWRGPIHEEGTPAWRMCFRAFALSHGFMTLVIHPHRGCTSSRTI